MVKFTMICQYDINQTKFLWFELNININGFGYKIHIDMKTRLINRQGIKKEGVSSSSPNENNLCEAQHAKSESTTDVDLIIHNYFGPEAQHTNRNQPREI